jgi:hypothetical protein
MQEYMINFRGYAYIWADSEKEAEHIFKKRFRKTGVNGEIEHTETDLYQDDEKERLWR